MRDRPFGLRSRTRARAASHGGSVPRTPRRPLGGLRTPGSPPREGAATPEPRVGVYRRPPGRLVRLALLGCAEGHIRLCEVPCHGATVDVSDYSPLVVAWSRLAGTAPPEVRPWVAPEEAAPTFDF
ncbi:hypothetical protein GCM10027075_38740 [Streptomyces heilongjiangensis]